MKVKELIATLQQENPEAEALFLNCMGGYEVITNKDFMVYEDFAKEHCGFDKVPAEVTGPAVGLS